jgi:hypothetical protein
MDWASPQIFNRSESLSFSQGLISNKFTDDSARMIKNQTKN